MGFHMLDLLVISLREISRALFQGRRNQDVVEDQVDSLSRLEELQGGIHRVVHALDRVFEFADHETGVLNFIEEF